MNEKKRSEANNIRAKIRYTFTCVRHFGISLMYRHQFHKMTTKTETKIIFMIVICYMYTITKTICIFCMQPDEFVFNIFCCFISEEFIL